MSRVSALTAYRNLLRSIRIAFEGDVATMNAARFEARNNFEANRDLPQDSKVLEKSISKANEVSKFLKENLVQGKVTDEGKYQLKIHEHTERGDNESIKQPAGTRNTLAGVKCCSAL
ncbi:mitochondrial zinc maintenance protein 1, mitochondrial [Phyllosticta citribraziliensis]|uniref:Mitochondrial zinc maintenance protein 1, mitochondrial n=1 Tax=Phyllosticta citribraziliensis TaxID=989973 RepID=A0ABR1LVM9_9PEZI